ncbi:hypothetical protein K7I13_08910 [Brucepastera parasyntrophica]|uniref:hypothetical protein n=1 Tax=Brucepastera parasyntrophica TaxID=2880008 RepID=UPI00210BF849|nr:hypothetical protein [Brucepastera parasyntrophica]ULQ58677.1 hypothetical protein K7I13_08910 [Brucepastera parasyntrophica]
MTPLPHKTIAVLAGIGWIGKNNLLVTDEYGSGLCLGVVLTDATLEITAYTYKKAKCGNCCVCADVCGPGVLRGREWNPSLQREEMLDVYNCTTCMKCMIFCPWTIKYMNAHV